MKDSLTGKRNDIAYLSLIDHLVVIGHRWENFLRREVFPTLRLSVLQKCREENKHLEHVLAIYNQQRQIDTEKTESLVKHTFEQMQANHSKFIATATEREQQLTSEISEVRHALEGVQESRNVLLSRMNYHQEERVYFAKFLQGVAMLITNSPLSPLPPLSPISSPSPLSPPSPSNEDTLLFTHTNPPPKDPIIQFLQQINVQRFLQENPSLETPIQMIFRDLHLYISSLSTSLSSLSSPILSSLPHQIKQLEHEATLKSSELSKSIKRSLLLLQALFRARDALKHREMLLFVWRSWQEQVLLRRSAALQWKRFTLRIPQGGARALRRLFLGMTRVRRGGECLNRVLVSSTRRVLCRWQLNALSVRKEREERRGEELLRTERREKEEQERERLLKSEVEERARRERRDADEREKEKRERREVEEKILLLKQESLKREQSLASVFLLQNSFESIRKRHLASSLTLWRSTVQTVEHQEKQHFFFKISAARVILLHLQSVEKRSLLYGWYSLRRLPEERFRERRGEERRGEERRGESDSTRLLLAQKLFEKWKEESQSHLRLSQAQHYQLSKALSYPEKRIQGALASAFHHWRHLSSPSSLVSKLEIARKFQEKKILSRVFFHWKITLLKNFSKGISLIHFLNVLVRVFSSRLQTYVSDWRVSSARITVSMGSKNQNRLHWMRERSHAFIQRRYESSKRHFFTAWKIYVARRKKSLYILFVTLQGKIHSHFNTSFNKWKYHALAANSVVRESEKQEMMARAVGKAESSLTRFVDILALHEKQNLLISLHNLQWHKLQRVHSERHQGQKLHKEQQLQKEVTERMQRKDQTIAEQEKKIEEYRSKAYHYQKDIEERIEETSELHSQVMGLKEGMERYESEAREREERLLHEISVLKSELRKTSDSRNALESEYLRSVKRLENEKMSERRLMEMEHKEGLERMRRSLGEGNEQVMELKRGLEMYRQRVEDLERECGVLRKDKELQAEVIAGLEEAIQLSDYKGKLLYEQVDTLRQQVRTGGKYSRG